MSLIDDFYVDCVKLDKTTISDGMGGFETGYVEGAQFKAAIVTQATSQERVAEKQVGSTIYQVTIPNNVALEYHDVFKRVSDQKIFRSTSDSDDVQTPKVASFQFRQITAEEWTLPV